MKPSNLKVTSNVWWVTTRKDASIIWLARLPPSHISVQQYKALTDTSIAAGHHPNPSFATQADSWVQFKNDFDNGRVDSSHRGNKKVGGAAYPGIDSEALYAIWEFMRCARHALIAHSLLVSSPPCPLPHRPPFTKIVLSFRDIDRW